MNKKVKTLVLLDVNALIHRAYHALPPLTTKKGEVVNAVYGFTATLLSVLEKFKPEYIAASFDLAGKTFRHTKYEAYKATRVKAPDDLYAQIPRVKEVARVFNIPIYEKEGFEADDCVGTLARQAEREGIDVIIVTGDSDALQLVTPHVKVFMLRKGIKDIVLYDEQAVVEKYGFTAAQIPDYKGLAGDTADNIPGVVGVGAKTATDLLQEFGTLENIYAHLSAVKESVRKKLETDKENAFLSKELGAIDTEAPVTLDTEACVSKDFDRAVVTGLFQELSFFSLMKRISDNKEPSVVGKEQSPKNKKQKIQKIATKKDLEKFVGNVETVAVYVKQSEGTLFGAWIEALHIATSKDEEVGIIWNEDTKIFLKEFLEDEKRKKIVYDGKALLHSFATEDIRIRGIVFDVLIAAYLLNSGSNVTLGHLILEECGEEEIVSPAQKIFLLWRVYDERLDEVSKTQIKGKTMRHIFENIEMPLLPILFAMEQTGIYLNTQKFQTLSVELTAELTILEKDIYSFSGKEFNINS